MTDSQMQIESIPLADRADVVELLGGAFRDHPMLPADPTGRRSRLRIKGLFDAFEPAPGAAIFAIRHEGQLACAAFVFREGYTPSKWKMAAMLCRMIRVSVAVVWLNRCAKALASTSAAS